MALGTVLRHLAPFIILGCITAWLYSQGYIMEVRCDWTVRECYSINEWGVRFEWRDGIGALINTIIAFDMHTLVLAGYLVIALIVGFVVYVDRWGASLTAISAGLMTALYWWYMTLLITKDSWSPDPSQRDPSRAVWYKNL
ncbi:ORF92R [black bullhead herpesvirus]|uniref:ORF92L n=1 Tax=black bullhead herpesvirus TaxID=508441 RepID=A0A2H5AJM1_9VIRU|nr:ORF92L [black bullhead herpesvirus]YP_009447912.1 ORF92R [black bullhead herpesvirus]AUG72264.1 ORF92L [black bullhead herpesvirus]AUG72334.1 ORF92R [black bullhead herpesvirus]